MIQSIDVIAALLLIVDAIRVETEAFVSRINSNRDRPVGSDGDLKLNYFWPPCSCQYLESIGVPRGYVDPGFNLESNLCLVQATVSILA